MSYATGVQLRCDGHAEGGGPCERVNGWQPSLKAARKDAKQAGWEVDVQTIAGGPRVDLCSVCVRSGQAVLVPIK